MPQRSATPSRPTSDLRAQTLAAARRLIITHGHRDVSMRDIAGEVGCSVSSLYVYFDNRDALIHTLIEEGFERWYAETLALVERHADPSVRLEAIARRYVAFGLENPELYEIMYMFNAGALRRLPKELFRRIRRSFDLWAATVQACGGASPVQEEDARVTAAALWATLHGAVSTLLTQRLDTRIDRTRYVNAVVRSVLATVRAEAS